METGSTPGSEHLFALEHSYSTSLNLVGLQLWRGSLLLADWLLDNAASFSPHEPILELAAGVGLTSVVAAMFSPVICTGWRRFLAFERLVRAFGVFQTWTGGKFFR